MHMHLPRSMIRRIGSGARRGGSRIRRLAMTMLNAALAVLSISISISIFSRAQRQRQREREGSSSSLFSLSSLCSSSSSSSSSIPPTSQGTYSEIEQAPTQQQRIPTPSKRPGSPPTAIPACVCERHERPTVTLDDAPKSTHSGQDGAGNSARTVKKKKFGTGRDEQKRPSFRETHAWRAPQRQIDKELVVNHQPTRLSRQETRPVTARTPPNATPPREEDRVVRLYEALNAAPSGHERPGTPAHTTPAAKFSTGATASESPRLSSKRQKRRKADVFGCGKLTAGQLYGIALAELRKTRLELTLTLQERSETNANVEKAETSVRSLRSLCERGDMAVKAVKAVHKHRIEHHLRQKKKSRAKVGKLGRKIQRLRSEEKVRMRAVGLDLIFPFRFRAKKY